MLPAPPSAGSSSVMLAICSHLGTEGRSTELQLTRKLAESSLFEKIRITVSGLTVILVEITINEELSKEITDGVKALFSVTPKINCDLIYHPVFVTDVTHCPDVPLPFKINHGDKDVHPS